MSNVSRFPPSAKTVHVEADIPASQLDEFNQAVAALIAGERPRMDNLDRDVATITRRALTALGLIEKAIEDHPSTGGARRLVRFLAGVYNGQDYPFDLTELRALDTELANACQCHGRTLFPLGHHGRRRLPRRSGRPGSAVRGTRHTGVDATASDRLAT